MKYAYYPGCSLHAMGLEFDRSTRAVCARLGIELAEVPDWNCCGATAAHSTSHLLGVALAARNLSLAGEQGLDELVIPCAACYNRLATARKEMGDDPALRRKVAEVTGRDDPGRVRVRSLLEVLGDLEPDRLAPHLVRPLTGLKAACYYGCLLVRPPAVTGFDDPEDPQSMDRLVSLTGARPVEWGYKTECCGAAHGVANEPVTLKLVGDILGAAARAGADVLVCACPLCQNNLDVRQGHANRALGTTFKLPVIYFTQLLGLATGLEPRELGLDKHFVPFRHEVEAEGDRN